MEEINVHGGEMGCVQQTMKEHGTERRRIITYKLVLNLMSATALSVLSQHVPLKTISKTFNSDSMVRTREAIATAVNGDVMVILSVEQ